MKLKQNLSLFAKFGNGISLSTRFLILKNIFLISGFVFPAAFST
jgi:hypothetical protein